MSDADEIERIIDTLNTGGLIDREDVAIYFGHLTARIAALEKRLKPFATRASTDAVQDAVKSGLLLTISNGKRMCAIDPKAFIEARTTLEASERGAGNDD